MYLKSDYYKKLKKIEHDIMSGHVLNPDGLRFIVESCDKDPEKIGKYFLEQYHKFKVDGVI